MAITSVPIRVNEDLRPSRLVKSIPSYIRRSIITIVRIFAVYRPFRFFAWIALTLFGLGFLIGLRFLWKYLGGSGEGRSEEHTSELQSLMRISYAVFCLKQQKTTTQVPY